MKARGRSGITPHFGRWLELASHCGHDPAVELGRIHRIAGDDDAPPAGGQAPVVTDSIRHGADFFVEHDAAIQAVVELISHVDQRSAHMMELLLGAVTARHAELVIVDITGIEDLDAQTLTQLVNVARAIRLLGTDCVLTGIRPGIAAALATLGADTSAMRTMATLHDALAQHLAPVVRPAGRPAALDEPTPSAARETRRGAREYASLSHQIPRKAVEKKERP